MLGFIKLLQLLYSVMVGYVTHLDINSKKWLLMYKGYFSYCY